VNVASYVQSAESAFVLLAAVIASGVNARNKWKKIELDNVVRAARAHM